MQNPATSAGELHGAILRSVSRSFYLSLRALPGRLREPIGLAYLLARATDTIADTAEIPGATRREALAALAAAIQGADPALARKQLEQFVPLQSDAAEQRLISAVPDCLELLSQTAPADRDDIRVVLEKINRAQALDVQRFGDPLKIPALPHTNDLEEYAYLIAGCVGEFWTALGFRHLSSFSELPQEEMNWLGKHYGMGLQLINILRDAGGDLRVGRCYFPAEELQNAGLVPAQILREPERFQPVFEKWMGEAERGLRSGMQYVDAIRNRRVRAATALPALIGARTLRRLRAAGPRALEERVKIPRGEVRGLIASIAITLASRKALAESFRKSLA